MIVRRRGEVELDEDARHVLLDRAWRDEEPVGDRLVRAALGHELEHLALARSQERERVVPATSAEELGHDRGVESGPPSATRRTADANSSTSATRSFRR